MGHRVGLPRFLRGAIMKRAFMVGVAWKPFLMLMVMVCAAQGSL
ncbi:MAG: hypothetical protein AB1664_13760 [Thermodesulfobacteriota bacterium]